MKPFFSIIMPTYNRGYIIKRAIDSILSQTFKNFEIVVVDDNSSDNTKEVIDNIKDKRVKYFKNPKNLGQIKNMRKGVSLSKGEWLLFLSDDDYFDNIDNLQLAFNLITKNPQLETIFIEHRIDNGFLKSDNIPKDIPEIIEGIEFLKKYYWEILNIVIKKEKFINLDLYNGESYFSEMEALDLICMSSKEVGYLKNFIVTFEIGEENLNKFKTSIYDFTISINYLKKPFLYGYNNKILTFEELKELYKKRFEKYHLGIVNSIVGELYGDILKKINSFYIDNIFDKEIDKFLETFAYTLSNLYQKNIDKELINYKNHLQEIKNNKERFLNSKKIIIYGTGAMGKSIFNQYSDKIVGFIDDFKEDSFMGKAIIKKEELKNYDYDIIVLATNNFSFIKKMKQNLPLDKVITIF